MKIKSILIIFMLVFTTLLTVNVSAESVESEDFEDGFINGGISNNWMSMNVIEDRHYIDNTTAHSGVKSVLHKSYSTSGAYGIIYFNRINITNINFEFYYNNTVGTISDSILFQLDDNDGTGNGLAIYADVDADTYTLKYHSPVNPYPKVDFATCNYNEWINIDLDFGSTEWNCSVYDDSNVFIGGHNFSYTRYAVNLNMTTFSQLTFPNQYIAGEYVYTYLDDLSITAGSTGSGNTGSENPNDMPSVDRFCFGNPNNIFPNEAFIQSRYFEIDYPMTYSGSINYVDLYLATGQSLIPFNEDYYHLYVNEVLFDEVSVTQYDSDTYRYRFYSEEGVSLANEKPLFEFYYSGTITNNGFCWFIERSEVPEVYGPYNYQVWFKEHSNSNYYGDGAFNGIASGLFTFYEPVICFHGVEDPDTVDIPSHYTDCLSGSKPTVQRYDNDFSFIYQLSSLFTDTTLEVVFDGSTVYTKDLIDVMGTVPYVPTHIGAYSARLNRSGANIAYYNFTVTAEDNSEFYIYTSPNPSSQCSDYKLYYKFNNSDGKTGAIYEGDTFSTAVLLSYINPNTSGIINLNSCSQGLHKYFLSVITDLGSSVLTSISHYVSGDDNAYIYVEDEELYLNNENTQTVSYGNPYFNVPVYIYDNNNLIADITNKYRSNFDYEVETSGNHNLKMYINTPNGLLEVCNTSFVAYGEGSGSGTGGGSIFPRLEQPLGSIVGFIITFISILMPLLIAGLIGGATRSKVEVPYPVFMLTGSLGVTISTILGLFPEWVIFFIIIVGILALVLSVIKEGKF